jgi:hypothetical protein
MSFFTGTELDKLPTEYITGVGPSGHPGTELYWHSEHGQPYPDPVRLFNCYPTHGSPKGAVIAFYSCANPKCYCNTGILPTKGMSPHHYIYITEDGYDRDHQQDMGVNLPVFTDKSNKLTTLSAKEPLNTGDRCTDCHALLRDGPRASQICTSCGKVHGGF